jgi:hypothetical protein
VHGSVMPVRRQPGKNRNPSPRASAPPPPLIRSAILSKLAGEGLGDPPPAADERRIEVERCLGLEPGALSPHLVARRQREHERRVTASINESLDIDISLGRNLKGPPQGGKSGR